MLTALTSRSKWTTIETLRGTLDSFSLGLLCSMCALRSSDREGSAATLLMAAEVVMSLVERRRRLV